MQFTTYDHMHQVKFSLSPTAQPVSRRRIGITTSCSGSLSDARHAVWDVDDLVRSSAFLPITADQHSITNANLRKQMSRLGWVGFDLVAQLFHVDAQVV
jgi:hypothetical protein